MGIHRIARLAALRHSTVDFVILFELQPASATTAANHLNFTSSILIRNLSAEEVIPPRRT